MHIGKFLSRFSLFQSVTLKAYGLDTEIPKPCTGKTANENLGQAILVGSRFGTGNVTHKVVLDIDHPSALYESSSGNFHLLIDKTLTREQYKKVVDVLAEVGILNQFHAKHFDEKKGTYVFAPWVDKAPYNCDSSKPGDI